MQLVNAPSLEELDGELLQRVKSSLCKKGYALHRKLEITVRRGAVRIRGPVRTYYRRQIAIECVKRVAGVRRVIDEIQVGPYRGNGIHLVESRVDKNTGASNITNRRGNSVHMRLSCG